MASIEVRIKLETLRVIDKNESSDDEPYLWVVFIKVDGTTINVANLAASSAALHAPSGSHGDLGPAADEMEGGDQVNIPDAIGRFDTTLVTDGLPSGIGESVSVVAIAVVALEEDATKDSAAEAGRKALVSTLQKELDKSIRAGISPNASQITDTAVTAVRQAIKDASISVLSFMPISSLLDIGGIVDPDDFVGSGVAGPFSFGQIRDAGSAGIPFTLDLTRKDSDDGRYRVVGRVRDRSITRYDAVWRPGDQGEVQHYARTFEQYQAIYDDLWSKNQRLQLLSTYILGGKILYDAVWRPGNQGEVQHYQKTFDQYQTIYNDLWPKGWRLHLLNTYVLGGKILYDAVWRPGNQGETQHYQKTFEQYQTLYNDLWPKGWRVELLNTYVLNGTLLYDAVWRPGNQGEVQHYQRTFDQYQTIYNDLWPKGWRLHLLNTTVLGGKILYDAVWRPGNQGEVQHYDRTFNQYQALYDDLWKKGNRLVMLNTYTVG